MPEEIIPTEESQEEEIPTPVEEKKEKRWLKPFLFSILGIVLASCLVFAGYKIGQRQIYPELGEGPTPTPMVVATLTPEPTATASPQPSPSPVSIEKIPYQPIASWQTYTDSQAEFSVQYPEKQKLGDSSPGKSVYFLSCLDDPQRGEICLTGYQIFVYDDYDGGSRREWYTRKFNEPYRPFYQDVIVAGVKALIIMDGNTGGSTGSFVLIPRGNKIYFFSFPFGWNPDTKEKSGLDFIKQILSTFRFLE